MTPRAESEKPPNAPAQPQSLLGLRGDYDLTMAMLAIPADVVAAVLPEALHLEPVPGSPPGTHPVLAAFGSQSGVREIATSLGGLNYLESVIAVPSVQVTPPPDGCRGPFSWLTRLDLDSEVAVLLGRAIGYPKHLSRMDETGSSYRISSFLLGDPLARISMRPYGPVGPPSAFPLFAIVQRLLTLPIVSQPPLGPLLYTLFMWDLASATMQASQITIEVDASDFPGLPAAQYRVDGIDQTSYGAFQMKVPWQLVLCPGADLL